LSNGRRFASRGRASGRRRGSSATRSENLTTAQVLERYREGPSSGLFTDGSCSGNPGPGGWGVVYVLDSEVLAERHGHDPSTTNNRMEFTAMIEALRLVGPAEPVDIYTDSRLVVDTITKWAAGWKQRGWKRRDGAVKNLELVQEAYALAQERPQAHIQWIRAHDGSRWNEYADALATAYMRDEV
jgi:ribonuclease HI